MGMQRGMRITRTGCDLARWMVYWDVVCARKPRIEFLLLQVSELLLKLVLVAG